MLYHLSKHLLSTLTPNIPTNNYYINLGIENGDIPRLSCSYSISNCLTGLADTVEIGQVLYVYEIESKDITSNEEVQSYVPFSKYTKEIWAMSEIKPLNVYKIKVVGKESNYIVSEVINDKVYDREIIKWGYMRI